MGLTFNIEVVSAKIIRLRHGTDKIYFVAAKLPEGTWPFESTATADVQITVARGDAEEYLEKHFPGIPTEVVELD